MNKVNIIAECCQNHNGDKEILKKMIHNAADNGADYVKIQAIRSKDLSFRERFEKGEVDETGKVLVIKRPYEQELERLAKLDLSLEEELWFVNECKIAGVSPMTTVFNRKSVNEVKNMGYDAIKIASYDCASIPLLKDVKDNWNKIFVSTQHLGGQFCRRSFFITQQELIRNPALIPAFTAFTVFWLPVCLSNCLFTCVIFQIAK